MEASKTTAAAVLAAGAMIAAAVYFKPMPGRYHVLKDEVGVRLDTMTGTFERCGRIATGGVRSVVGIPDDEVRRLQFDPTNYRAEQFDEAHGKGAADKALAGTTVRLLCVAWEDWP